MSSKNAIEISNLKFKWEGSSHYLLDIPKLEIPKSKKIFLQGSSGSGKTTLLNLLSGVLDFKEGQIKIFDQNIKDMSSSQKDTFRGDHMGFVFQLFNLLPFLSVYENIALPLEFSKTKNSKVQDPEAEVKRLLESLKLYPAKYLYRKVT